MVKTLTFNYIVIKSGLPEAGAPLRSEAVNSAKDLFARTRSGSGNLANYFSHNLNAVAISPSVQFLWRRTEMSSAS